jgi:hypothetical protein
VLAAWLDGSAAGVSRYWREMLRAVCDGVVGSSTIRNGLRLLTGPAGDGRGHQRNDAATLKKAKDALARALDDGLDVLLGR